MMLKEGREVRELGVVVVEGAMCIGDVLRVQLEGRGVEVWKTRCCHRSVVLKVVEPLGDTRAVTKKGLDMPLGVSGRLWPNAENFRSG